MYGTLLGLENKLVAVYYFNELLKDRLTQLRSGKDHILDYKLDQQQIALFEAYLSAIYSTLELVAKINRSFDPSLPSGFNRQNKKTGGFKDGEASWYNKFHDARSETTHYSCLLPVPSENKIVFYNENPRDRLFFSGKRETYEVAIDEVLSWSNKLEAYLNAWASEKLKLVDLFDDPVGIIEGFNADGTVRSKEIKVKEILSKISTKA